jgi:hypothetical protein
MGLLAREALFLLLFCRAFYPDQTVKFILTMGKGAGDLLAGSDVFYHQIEGLQDVAVEMLIEDGFPQKLSEDAFVFFMHQGYQFNFFNTSAGDDPPVYRYLEETDLETFPLIYSHLNDLLLQELQDHARYIQRWSKKAVI